MQTGNLKLFQGLGEHPPDIPPNNIVYSLNLMQGIRRLVSSIHNYQHLFSNELYLRDAPHHTTG